MRDCLRSAMRSASAVSGDYAKTTKCVHVALPAECMPCVVRDERVKMMAPRVCVRSELRNLSVSAESCFCEGEFGEGVGKRRGRVGNGGVSRNGGLSEETAGD